MEWHERLGIKIENFDLRSMEIDELKKHRDNIIDGMRSFLDMCDKKGRDLSQDESESMDAGEAHLDELAKELKRRPANFMPSLVGGSFGEGATKRKKSRGGVGVDYRTLFYGNANAPLQDIRDPEDFFRNVTEKRAMVDGGAFVPESHVNIVYDATLDLRGLFAYTKVLPVDQGSNLTVGAWDNADRSNGQHFGGVAVQWRTESTAFSVVEPKTRQIEYSLHKMGMFVNCSRELLEGVGNFSAMLSQKMAFALNAEGEEQILRGTGIGRPLGVLNSPCKINISRATAGAVGYADLASMLGRLHPSLHKDCTWIVNQEVLPQLLQMVDPLGNYVWLPNSAAGSEAKLPGTLFGHPLLVSDFCSALGSEGDVVLGNFGLYGLAMKKQVSFEATNAARWLNDEWSYRSIWRIDGKPLLNEPITPAHGSDTVSAFVVLD
jgi:HK97 family phage major capsid protein